MRRMASMVACAVIGAVTATAAHPLTNAGAQGGRQRAAAKKPPVPSPPKIEQATVRCRESLGTGVRTMASYCFVLAGRDPTQGVLISLPAHRGPATLLFNLHNRHTFSEEDIKAGRGFARYSAGIGVLTMTGELLGRGAVQSEFRTARDLFERIGGGAGPGGLKAVAPLGNEEVLVTIPATVTQVSLLGELLDTVSSIGRETATPGRPVAIVSNVRVEYHPGK
ncbi:MAG: hypothetical protein ABIP65_03595 [Vicinamibacterales bacterium]